MGHRKRHRQRGTRKCIIRHRYTHISFRDTYTGTRGYTRQIGARRCRETHAHADHIYRKQDVYREREERETPTRTHARTCTHTHTGVQKLGGTRKHRDMHTEKNTHACAHKHTERHRHTQTQ
jgi:hypothetical protein